MPSWSCHLRAEKGMAHFCGYAATTGSDGYGDRWRQLRLPPITCLSKAVALILWGAALLVVSGPSHSEAFYASPGPVESSMSTTHAALRPMYAALSAEASGLVRILSSDKQRHAALPAEASRLVRISTSELLQRQEIERSIRAAAFEQFGSHRTGRLYNVSVAGFSAGDVRAVRLRSGSFKRYGIRINEFTIPQGCIVDPIPKRILLVYTKFSNTSLFGSVTAGYALASPVFSVLIYDASNLSSSLTPRSISVSTTGLPVSIRFAEHTAFGCAYFSDNTTAVTISESLQGTCQSDHLGSFAAVSSTLAPAPAPTPSPVRQKKHSNTWKIIVGSVIGGLALLTLLTVAGLGIAKRRKDAKLSRMEYQTEHGETLQMATIRNSRVPTATNTRTQATLVNDYAV